jgi:SAM-dependent methyltransferase
VNIVPPAAGLPLRPCPVCDAVAPDVLFRQEFETLGGVSALGGYDVVTCRNCGLAYADRIPSQDVFDRYYREASKYEYDQRDGQESPYDTERMEVIVRLLASLIPSRDASILDIGCASARLLYLLRQLGFHRVTGLDPSAGCVATAKRLYDIQVVQGSFAAFPKFGQLFDVAILVGVLEHVRDLDTAMRQLSATVSVGGMVYVEVPDVLEFWRWPNAPFQDFSIEHINFFSPQSLTNLFARYGFTPVLVEQNARQQSYRTMMSNVSAAFRKDGSGERPIETERVSKPALERYIEQCRKEEESVAAALSVIASSQKAIIVWGVGTNATRLLTTTRLVDANIVCFIDSNSKYHGKMLTGRSIEPPNVLRSRPEPVLILSRVFQKEIADQVRSLVGPDREILTLYDID